MAAMHNEHNLDVADLFTPEGYDNYDNCDSYENYGSFLNNFNAKAYADTDKQSQRLNKILSILPSAVIVLNNQGVITEANATAADLLNIPLVGEAWRNIIERAFAPRIDDGHEVSLKDGRRVSVTTRSLAPEPGQILVITDMTETRAMQERLNQQKRLQSMGKMLTQLAHQLRTPLSTALLYTGHLPNGNINNAKRQQYAEKINHCLHNLDQQLRDMLLFARGETKLLDKVNVAELLHQVVTVTEGKTKQHQVKLELLDETNGLVTYANAESLLGALQNLVTNAVDACEESCLIKLTARKLSDTEYQFVIADNGSGMDDATLHSVMQPFFTTKSHGTGLGLAVVDAVVKAHAGNIEIKSTPNQGTKISINLPVLQQ